MSGLSPEFRAELEPLLARLADATGRPGFEPEADPASHKVRLQDNRILVPIRYEVHWRRFRTMPTELVRDVAYAAWRQKGEGDEADWQALAESFVRDHLMWSD